MIPAIELARFISVTVLAPTQSRDELAEFQEVMRRQFSNTGSAVEIILVVLSLCGVVALLFLLDRLQQRRRTQSAPNHPRQLFNELNAELDLSVQQRELLASMAAGLKLANPAVLLLCPALFDRYAGQWEEREGDSDAGFSAQCTMVTQTRRALFGAPVVGSRR